MSGARTLTALGAALGQQIPELARASIEFCSESSLEQRDVEACLEVLLDRLCLSLTLAKPVGLTTWAEREGARIGRAAIIDMTSAACQSIAAAASCLGREQSRLLAFLDVLSREIERAALGADSDDREHPSEAVEALLAMLAERDFGTCCHSKATAQWARRLAVAMECDAATTEFVVMCALLHDIGKVSTPESVLNKPGPLTVAEWELMRDHSGSGARILNQVPSLRACAIIVRAHHERFDGCGYPDGLAGSAIPFEARVVAVADAFHAMISDRPYRHAIEPRRALQILTEGRGSQWDPVVVDAMVAMFSRRTTLVSHRPRQVSSA